MAQMTKRTKKIRVDRSAKLRHRKFAREYVENGMDAKAAYTKTYPEITERSAEVGGSRLLSDAEVQAEIKRRVEKISPEYIIDLIHGLAISAKRDSDKLRAAELLGKWQALFKETATNQLNLISTSDLDQIRSSLASKARPEDVNQTIVPALQPIDMPKDTEVGPMHTEQGGALSPYLIKTLQKPEGLRGPLPPSSLSL